MADSSAVPGGIDPDTQIMYEHCYKAGFDQYHKWLIANHPDGAKEWHKKEQEIKKHIKVFSAECPCCKI